MLTIFDFDGTLCDSRPSIVASLHALLEELGEDRPAEVAIDARVREGRGLHSTLRLLLPGGEAMPEAEIDRWAARYRAHYDTVEGEGGPPFDGAIEAVRAAAELGPVAVVSMKGHDLLGKMIRLYGLSDAVTAHFGDDEVRPLKPDSALFHDHIAPAIGRFSHGVVIGDTPKDLTFARNAGLTPIYASYGYGDDVECREVGYDHAIHSIAEVTPLLLRLATEPPRHGEQGTSVP